MALTAIDAGASAINRSFISGVGRTAVTKVNPANATGYITRITVWGGQGATAVQVASFSESGDDLTTTGIVSLSDIDSIPKTWSAPVDFIPFAINSGDYIGIYLESFAIDAGGTSQGYWWKVGDYIPCTNEPFLFQENYDLSLNATGYDEVKGWINVGDDWKIIDDIQINIGDVWKTVSDVNLNIGDAWKNTWQS